ncbi:MAG TPA: hypothetical protein VIY47_06780 [Ignavibacteriaceae bacterium]
MASKKSRTKNQDAVDEDPRTKMPGTKEEPRNKAPKKKHKKANLKVFSE